MCNETDDSKSLDERRRAAGLTLAQLARLAGVPYYRVWKTCSGGFRLSAEELNRVEAALIEQESE